MNGIHSALAKQGYTRSSTDRVLGGVCGGLADKLGTNAWAMRALVFALMVVLPGSPLLFYPIAWVLMPEDTFRELGARGPQDRLGH